MLGSSAQFARRLLAWYYGLRGISLVFLPAALAGPPAARWAVLVLPGWEAFDSVIAARSANPVALVRYPNVLLTRKAVAKLEELVQRYPKDERMGQLVFVSATPGE